MYATKRPVCQLLSELQSWTYGVPPRWEPVQPSKLRGEELRLSCCFNYRCRNPASSTFYCFSNVEQEITTKLHCPQEEMFESSAVFTVIRRTNVNNIWLIVIQCRVAANVCVVVILNLVYSLKFSRLFFFLTEETNFVNDCSVPLRVACSCDWDLTCKIPLVSTCFGFGCCKGTVGTVVQNEMFLWQQNWEVDCCLPENS